MAKSKHRNSDTETGTYATELSARKLHKDWRAWLIVGLMLIAMITYVLTLDESILPAIMGR
jgi:hypothetical protein